MASQARSVVVKPLAKTRVIGLRETVPNYGAQGMLWGRVMQFCGSHQIALDTAVPIYAIFYDQGYKPQDVDMQVCAPILENAVVPEETGPFNVYWSEEYPRVASNIHKGAYHSMKDSYAALFEWISANNEKPSGAAREVFHVSMANYDGNEDSLVTEIIVPLA